MNQRTTNLYDALPETFTYADVEALRNKFSLNGKIKDYVCTWKRNNLITKVRHGEYQKNL